eukprot:TRINITY_DN8618_c0_g1_i1.p1 TRINITY_DN8618_c0_g1~~TRINITY_DN8618_c0_g1_i1.p1  ORF type:complete len:423 (+),score=57.52 TRINITY_DN8618_c0_g1_i1:263-1531(+)
MMGVGGARVLGRKYIAQNVIESAKTKYSSFFVVASAFGITLGPGLSALLSLKNPFTFAGLQFSCFTYVSWLMTFLWAIFTVCVMIYFVDPYSTNPIIGDAPTRDVLAANFPAFRNSTLRGDIGGINVETLEHPPARKPRGLPKETDFRQTYLIQPRSPSKNSFVESENTLTQRLLEKGPVPEKQDKFLPPDSFPKILVNEIPDAVTFFCVFVLFYIKVVQEGFFIQLPLLMKDKFQWTPLDVSIFHSVSSLYIIPLVGCMGLLSKKLQDRKILLISLLVLSLGCGIKFDIFGYDNLHLFQDLIGSVIIYISSMVAESMDISLLAKVISPKLGNGFFNAGLISGWADAGGRAFGSALISAVSKESPSGIPGLFFSGTFLCGLIITIIGATRYKELRKKSKLSIKPNDMSISLPEKTVINPIKV